AGDPLERPAHRRRVRRDRGAARPRAADRAHWQPGAARLHRAEAPLAAPPRARGVRGDQAGAAAEGLRALSADGEGAIDAADASGTLLFDVGARRWSEEVCAALEVPLEWLPPAFESTEIAGAGDQAAGALGVGIDRPGRLSVVLGTSGVVFAVLPAYGADAGARVHVFCHAVPGTWHAMGGMLTAAAAYACLAPA